MLKRRLGLGNLDASRDWGHAKDYVKAMWMILQTDTPDDYICATGVSHSVKDLCQFVFEYLDLNYLDYIKVDQKHFRPEELKDLKGDSSKLMKKVGWCPEYNFQTMLREMVEYWLEYYKEKDIIYA